MNKGKNVVDLIPTHDPQTGELNPYYERLTEEVNLPPLIFHNMDLVLQFGGRE
jgi:hypothetical protein